MNEGKEYEPGKAPFIYGMMPGLTERGKIKIGKKGESRQGSSGSYQLPTRLDHFIITTLERDKTGNFVRDYALYASLKLPDNPKRIPIMLLFDEIPLVFQYRLTCYKGKTLFCSGDGRAAHQIKDQQKPERVQVVCPCYRKEPTFQGDDGRGNGKCKINGKLSVVIAGANIVGGVWVFRTTGYNSTVGIISSLTLIKTMTGGILAGIPLVMTIQPKVAINPIDGKSQTIQVVGIEYSGSIDDLQNGALKLAQKNAEYRARLGNVEREVQKLISVDADVVDQAGDIAEEFYPEEAQLVEPESVGTPEPAGAVAEGTAAPQASPTQSVPVAPAPSATAEAPARRGRKPKTKQAPTTLSAPAVAPEPAAAQAPSAPPSPMVDKLEDGIATAQATPAPALAVPDGAVDVDLFD
jgi:hypothetical protein